MKLTVDCLYSCKGCGIVKRVVTVPAREAEDVIVWVEATGALIGADHTKISPHCPSKHCDIMIPMTGTDRVGGAPVQ